MLLATLRGWKHCCILIADVSRQLSYLTNRSVANEPVLLLLSALPFHPAAGVKTQNGLFLCDPNAFYIFLHYFSLNRKIHNYVITLWNMFYSIVSTSTLFVTHTKLCEKRQHCSPCRLWLNGDEINVMKVVGVTRKCDQTPLSREIVTNLEINSTYRFFADFTAGETAYEDLGGLYRRTSTYIYTIFLKDYTKVSLQ